MRTVALQVVAFLSEVDPEDTLRLLLVAEVPRVATRGAIPSHLASDLFQTPGVT